MIIATSLCFFNVNRIDVLGAIDDIMDDMNQSKMCMKLRTLAKLDGQPSVPSRGSAWRIRSLEPGLADPARKGALGRRPLPPQYEPNFAEVFNLQLYPISPTRFPK